MSIPQVAAVTSGSSNSGDASRQVGSEPSMSWMVELGEPAADRAEEAAEEAAVMGGGAAVRGPSTVRRMNSLNSGTRMGARVAKPRGVVRAASVASGSPASAADVALLQAGPPLAVDHCLEADGWVSQIQIGR